MTPEEWERLRSAFAAHVSFPDRGVRGPANAPAAIDPELGLRLQLLLAADRKATEKGFLEDVALILPEESAPVDEAMPETIGSYRVVERIGRGGMGLIYRAEDLRLGRRIAVKTLPRTFSTDEEHRGRLLREARLLAALRHPNVATVHSLEEADGRFFITMELLEGEDLATVLERGPLPPDEAERVALEVARGLEAAHTREILHRDLKPGNVFIESDGRVKVLDFGLAVNAGDREERDDLIAGTPGYMSPEQIRRLPLDERSDIWSFGCLLYHCLCGTPPFEGATRAETMTASLDHQPSWKRLPAETPEEIRDLLARCLEKSPERRPAATSRIVRFLEERRRRSDTARRRMSRPRLLAIGLLCALAVSAGAWAIRSLLLQGMTIQVDGTRISGIGPVLGAVWTAEHPSGIVSVVPVPWFPGPAVAYGVGPNPPEGGTLFVRDLRSGRLLWQATPDHLEAAAVFGDELAEDYAFFCQPDGLADLEGDGEPELVVRYMHSKYFPAFIAAYRADGTRLGTYYNPGHLLDVAVQDLDGDGKDEVLVAGTNNVRAYEGATVILLGAGRFHGSAEDPVAIADGRMHESDLNDVALARLVLPDFDPVVMHLLGDKIRLEARDLRISRSRKGRARIAVAVYAGDVAVEVNLDPCLRPHDVQVTDELVTAMASWPADERERFQEGLPEWLGRAQWLADCVSDSTAGP